MRTGYDLALAVNRQDIIALHTQQPSLNPLKAQVWRLQAPSKLKVFIWKALSGALAVLDVLRSRGLKCDSVCQICGLEGESINHVLFSCTLARQVWAISGFPSPQGGFDDCSVWTNMSYLFATGIK